jgi:hypothetical protein
MALFHVYASVISKGAETGKSQGLALYLGRLEQENGTQAAGYLERNGAHAKEDLVASGSHRLPQWARTAQEFWSSADHYERGGKHRKGVIARHYQFTLPRELSQEGRLALAEDVRMAFFDHYPHTWAVHCPATRNGAGENPHLHVMFSPRRDDASRTQDAATWFSQKTNGARKDRVWDEKRTLQGVRHEFAILANATLEREGQQVAISARRLSVRGHGRKTGKMLSHTASALLKRHAGTALEDIKNEKTRQHVAKARERMAEIEVNRALLRTEFHPRENAQNLETWHAQKQHEGITDLSRQAILDHVRTRFWAHDQSPVRQQERAVAMMVRATEATLAYEERLAQRIAQRQQRQVGTRTPREQSPQVSRGYDPRGKIFDRGQGKGM